MIFFRKKFPKNKLNKYTVKYLTLVLPQCAEVKYPLWGYLFCAYMPLDVT